MNTQELIKLIKPYRPEKILLFGSHAYGKPGKESDLDIAIIKDTKKPFHDRLIEVRKLLWTDTPVDVFVFTPKEFDRLSKENPFVREIKDKGKIVYEE